MYYDVNSLNSGAMVRFLPKSHFCWITEEQWTRIDWETLPDKSETGYILEVHLEYSDGLHDLHNQMKITPEIYSPFQQANKNRQIDTEPER